ncbi:MAG TPA: hypothetical protein VMD92_17540 [Acidobacteriaceae bacterium]|nr:hypothetical protein [Acidobacteriaceae bacterium]
MTKKLIYSCVEVFAVSDLLATETRVFQQRREEWLREHAGAYVAIQGEDVAGFFESYGEAFKAGLARFGSRQNFLIEQIWRTDPVYFVF